MPLGPHGAGGASRPCTRATGTVQDGSSDRRSCCWAERRVSSIHQPERSSSCSVQARSAAPPPGPNQPATIRSRTSGRRSDRVASQASKAPSGKPSAKWCCGASTRTAARRSCGWCTARSSTALPPSEEPTAITGARSSSSTRRAKSSATCRTQLPVAGWSLSPQPRQSTATTRWPAASSRVWPCQTSRLVPQPCTSRTAGPVPWSSYTSRQPSGSTANRLTTEACADHRRCGSCPSSVLSSVFRGRWS